MMMAVAAVDAVRPVDDPTEGDDEEDPYDTPGSLVTCLQSSDPS